MNHETVQPVWKLGGMFSVAGHDATRCVESRRRNVALAPLADILNHMRDNRRSWGCAAECIQL